MPIDKSMSSNKKLLSLVNLVKLFVFCIQKCYPSKNFRGSDPNPAGGLNTPQTPTCKAPPSTAGYAPACLAMVVSEFRLSTFVLGGLRGFTATSDLVCNDCTINQFHVHSVPIISFFFFFCRHSQASINSTADHHRQQLQLPFERHTIVAWNSICCFARHCSPYILDQVLERSCKSVNKASKDLEEVLEEHERLAITF